MNHSLPFFILFFSLSLAIVDCNAQSDSISVQAGLNMEEEKESYEKLPKIPESFGSKSDELPFSASLKAYCPRVVHQGDMPTSVGWSVGYGALTMLYAKRMGWTDAEITEEAFSAMFVYNHIYRDICQGGTTLARAGAFLKNSGNCKSRDFDSVVENCGKEPSVRQLAFAKRFRIKDYFTVFGFDEKGKKKTFLTKRSIAKGTPVVVGMRIRENFKQLNKNNAFWKPGLGDTTLLKKGQALVVVAYDDRKGAFQVLNSWGADWGDNGYAWIKYRDFENHCPFAYQYMLKENNASSEKVTMTGEFSLQYTYFPETKDTMIFKFVKPNYKFDYSYEIGKRDWEIGDQYQLIVHEMNEGQYLYVFSFDDEGVSEHWPRSSETAIIPYKRIGVVIPDEERALVRRIEGTDNICILYSLKNISDYHERLQKLKNAEGDFKSRFDKVFGDLLIPEEEIDYDTNRMKFSIDANTKGTVVPIVLAIEGK